MKRSVSLMYLLLAVPFAHGDEPVAKQRMLDSGFESLAVGKLQTTTTGIGWEVQRIGRPKIQGRLVVECVGDKTIARSGGKALKLSLPRDTVGFEFVTVGQRLKLLADREYEASVWVRWADGPDQAPPNARVGSPVPSAIVSFWARHRDATGHFAGRDVWLFDNRWQRLTFRFRATNPEQKTLVYVSLLPNQKPRKTTVYIDDFVLAESEADSTEPTKKGNLVIDGGFDKAGVGRLGKGAWAFANMGGTRIAGNVIEGDGDKFFRIAMNKNTTNFESAQLWQMIALEKGVCYRVRCRMRWDNFREGPGTPIVNYGFYHEATNTWYGPIDQNLEKSAKWTDYEFVHIPPFGGKWKLYVQLNGWGNFGNALTVSFDGFECRAEPTAKKSP